MSAAGATTQATTLAILAGGAGSRMGHPKGDIRIADKPILAYLLDRFAWAGPTMLVTAPGREHPPGWERFDLEVVDPVADLGPLRGVLTALENARTELVAMATVDMPGVGAEQIAWLIDQIEQRPAAPALMTRRGADQVEPFPSVFRHISQTLVRARLDARELSVQALSREAAVRTVNAPSEWDESVWTNLNRPEDVARFTQLSQSSRSDR